jgi:hypothetical protein
LPAQVTDPAALRQVAALLSGSARIHKPATPASAVSGEMSATARPGVVLAAPPADARPVPPREAA